MPDKDSLLGTGAEPDVILKSTFSFQHVPHHLFVIKPGVPCLPEVGRWQESPQVLSVGSHISILAGLQPRSCRTPSPPHVFPQPAVRCYWPHPSCKSSAKYACSAQCRASLLSNSTFLCVAGGLSTDQATVFLLILLTDLRSWLCIQPSRAFVVFTVGRVYSMVDVLPCGSCFTFGVFIDKPPDISRWVTYLRYILDLPSLPVDEAKKR